jgi:hypothetical protein
MLIVFICVLSLQQIPEGLMFGKDVERLAGAGFAGGLAGGIQRGDFAWSEKQAGASLQMHPSRKFPN